jgi:hypothetical protein
MPLRPHLLGYGALRPVRSAALRTGIYVAICLSLVLAAWLFVANRVPFLERFAWERNLAAAAAAGFLALVPVLRFYRFPWRLFVSGITAWVLFSLVYRGFCIYFILLSKRLGAFHLFMLGSVLFTIAATLAWIGTLLWTVRDRQVSHSRHHLS